MREELLKIAQESLSSEEVSEIVKEKFKDAFANTVESAFQWGEVKDALKKKVTEVMVSYIEKSDFSEFIPKLDAVLTELVNSDNCLADRKILENFKELMTEPEQKEMKVTDLFREWIKHCNEEIETDDLEVCYDDGVSYEPVDCVMRFEIEDKPSWSSIQRAVIIFENEHDESINIEIPVSKWILDSGKEEPYALAISNDIRISSLRRLTDIEVLLLRLERAGTEIVIDRDHFCDCIHPNKEPEATFS